MRCKKCGLDKDLTKENWEWRGDSQKYRSACKTCLNDASVERRYKKNCIALGIEFFPGDHVKYKICSGCNERTPIDLFTSKMGGLCERCRVERRKETQERFDEAHPGRRSEIRKAYVAKNKKIILERARQYRKDPRVREKERFRKARYRKRKGDLRKSISSITHHRISCLIRKDIKTSGNKKTGSILNHLPYSIEDLKFHIESQFEPWMNWNNWGVYRPDTWLDENHDTWTWQIDHIIPRSDLPYDSMKHPNFLKCWNLDNLRPLSSKENILDGVNRSRHRALLAQ